MGYQSEVGGSNTVGVGPYHIVTVPYVTLGAPAVFALGINGSPPVRRSSIGRPAAT